MWENIEILNFHNRRKEEGFSIRTKLLYYKNIHRTSISNRKGKNSQLFINKPVSRGLSTLELRKILMYQFWHYYDKPKYGDKARLCYIVYIKIDDIYKEIAEDVETKFDTTTYELDRPLPKGKKIKK